MAWWLKIRERWRLLTSKEEQKQPNLNEIVKSEPLLEHENDHLKPLERDVSDSIEQQKENQHQPMVDDNKQPEEAEAPKQEEEQWDESKATPLQKFILWFLDAPLDDMWEADMAEPRKNKIICIESYEILKIMKKDKVKRKKYIIEFTKAIIFVIIFNIIQ